MRGKEEVQGANMIAPSPSLARFERTDDVGPARTLAMGQKRTRPLWQKADLTASRPLREVVYLDTMMRVLPLRDRTCAVRAEP